jgi:LAS superfamily LD-carboxypeptidase LdcB
VWAAILVVVLSLAALPGGAQDLTEEIEKLRQEQERVKEDREAQAQEVDAATAEAGQLAAALEVMNAEVNAQASKVAEAEQRLAAAQARHDAAVEAVNEMTAELTVLEGRLSDRAISSFITQTNPPSPILEESDPNVAVRMQSLVDAVTGSGLSVADELKAVKEDLEVEQASADEAQAEAEEIQNQLTADLAELELRRNDQAALAAAAEERLEAQLAEAWALSELDQELSSEIVAKTDELARQAAVAQSRGGGGGGNTAGATFPSTDDIVNVQGIWVHRDIASNVDQMLSAASAAGHNFSGGGYRDSQSQIRLRRAHCGTSDYAIYQMPSSQCSPPTARPGASMHEQGKALDLQYNGSLITSRSNAGFKWLSANAASYGFYNLPSEPWHWSVNGR